MKNYLVLYEAGKAGTWLTWLINQHANFPQYKTYRQERVNLKQQLDVACLGADFHWEEQTYEENCEIKHQYAMNAKYTKRCVKVIPNHELRNIEDPSKPSIEYLDKVIPQLNPDLIVWPILSETMIEEFALRWYVIWHVTRGMMPGESEYDLEYFRDGLVGRYQRTAAKIYSRYAPVYQVDVGRLLKAEHHWDEYLRLADAIGETPLDIRDKIIDYRVWAYTDIMDKVGRP